MQVRQQCRGQFFLVLLFLCFLANGSVVAKSCSVFKSASDCGASNVDEDSPPCAWCVKSTFDEAGNVQKDARTGELVEEKLCVLKKDVEELEGKKGFACNIFQNTDDGEPPSPGKCGTPSSTCTTGYDCHTSVTAPRALDPEQTKNLEVHANSEIYVRGKLCIKKQLVCSNNKPGALDFRMTCPFARARGSMYWCPIDGADKLNQTGICTCAENLKSAAHWFVHVADQSHLDQNTKACVLKEAAVTPEMADLEKAAEEAALKVLKLDKRGLTCRGVQGMKFLSHLYGGDGRLEPESMCKMRTMWTKAHGRKSLPKSSKCSENESHECCMAGAMKTSCAWCIPKKYLLAHETESEDEETIARWKNATKLLYEWGQDRTSVEKANAFFEDKFVLLRSHKSGLKTTLKALRNDFNSKTLGGFQALEVASKFWLDALRSSSWAKSLGGLVHDPDKNALTNQCADCQCADVNNVEKLEEKDYCCFQYSDAATESQIIRDNTVVEDSGLNASAVVYAWRIGEWGNCDKRCGKGEKRRPVVCTKFGSKNDVMNTRFIPDVVDDQFCLNQVRFDKDMKTIPSRSEKGTSYVITSERPSDDHSCFLAPCSRWKLTETCNSCKPELNAVCQTEDAHGNWKASKDANCYRIHEHGGQALLFQMRESRKTRKGGKNVPSAPSIVPNAKGLIEGLRIEHYVDAPTKKPRYAVHGPLDCCANRPVYKWRVIGTWSECSKSCGTKIDPGSQVRAVACIRTMTADPSVQDAISDDSMCDKFPKPIISRPCPDQKSCLRWVANEACVDDEIVISPVTCQEEVESRRGDRKSVWEVVDKNRCHMRCPMVGLGRRRLLTKILPQNVFETHPFDSPDFGVRDQFFDVDGCHPILDKKNQSCISAQHQCVYNWNISGWDSEHCTDCFVPKIPPQMTRDVSCSRTCEGKPGPTTVGTLHCRVSQGEKSPIPRGSQDCPDTIEKFNPCRRWRSRERCLKRQVVLNNTCELELKPGIWTPMHESSMCVRDDCHQAKPNRYHHYPWKNYKFGQERVYDTMYCAPTTAFKGENEDESKCGADGFEYFWRYSDWGQCNHQCGVEGEETRTATCVKVETTSGEEVELQSSEHEASCGKSAGERQIIVRPCPDLRPCTRWAGQVICDHEDSMETKVVSHCEVKREGKWVKTDDKMCIEHSKELGGQDGDRRGGKFMRALGLHKIFGARATKNYMQNPFVDGALAKTEYFAVGGKFADHGRPRLRRKQKCAHPNTGFVWKTGDWEPCKSNCDIAAGLILENGKEHRELFCASVNGTDGSHITSDIEKCKINGNGSEPSLTRMCTVETVLPCSRWAVRKLCSKQRTESIESVCEVWDPKKSLWAISKTTSACVSAAENHRDGSGSGSGSSSGSSVVFAELSSSATAKEPEDRVIAWNKCFASELPGTTIDFIRSVLKVLAPARRLDANSYQVVERIVKRRFQRGKLTADMFVPMFNAIVAATDKQKGVAEYVASVFSLKHMNNPCDLQYLRILANENTLKFLDSWKKISGFSDYFEDSDRLSELEHFIKGMSELVSAHRQRPRETVWSEVESLFNLHNSLKEQAKLYVQGLMESWDDYLDLDDMFDAVDHEITSNMATLSLNDFSLERVCTKPCGPKENPGVQVRTASCNSKKRKHLNGLIGKKVERPAPSALCLEHTPEPPVLQRPCPSQEPCLRWAAVEMCDERTGLIGIGDEHPNGIVCEKEENEGVWTPEASLVCKNCPKRANGLPVNRVTAFPSSYGVGVFHFDPALGKPRLKLNDTDCLQCGTKCRTDADCDDDGVLQENICNQCIKKRCGMPNKMNRANYFWEYSPWGPCVREQCTTEYPDTPINRILTTLSLAKTKYADAGGKYSKLVKVMNDAGVGRAEIAAKIYQHFLAEKNKVLVEKRDMEAMEAMLLSFDAVDIFLRARRYYRNDDALYELVNLFRSRQREAAKKYFHFNHYDYSNFEAVIKIAEGHTGSSFLQLHRSERRHARKSETQALLGQHGLFFKNRKKKKIQQVSQDESSEPDVPAGKNTSNPNQDVRWEEAQKGLGTEVRPGRWTDNNGWIPHDPQSASFGGPQYIYVTPGVPSPKPFMAQGFEQVICGGYEWQASAVIPSLELEGTCAASTCEDCVSDDSGGVCEWQHEGDRRGCRTRTANSTSENASLVIKNQLGCRKLSISDDPIWGPCHGCPSSRKRFVSCVERLKGESMTEEKCKGMKPRATETCTASLENIVDEFKYTSLAQKKTWQHAWKIRRSGAGKACNSTCVRFCDARAFRDATVSQYSGSDYQVVVEKSPEYNECLVQQRDTSFQIPAFDPQNPVIFTLPAPDPCGTLKPRPPTPTPAPHVVTDSPEPDSPSGPSGDECAGRDSSSPGDIVWCKCNENGKLIQNEAECEAVSDDPKAEQLPRFQTTKSTLSFGRASSSGAPSTYKEPTQAAVSRKDKCVWLNVTNLCEPSVEEPSTPNPVEPTTPAPSACPFASPCNKPCPAAKSLDTCFGLRVLNKCRSSLKKHYRKAGGETERFKRTGVSWIGRTEYISNGLFGAGDKDLLRKFQRDCAEDGAMERFKQTETAPSNTATKRYGYTPRSSRRRRGPSMPPDTAPTGSDTNPAPIEKPTHGDGKGGNDGIVGKDAEASDLSKGGGDSKDAKDGGDSKDVKDGGDSKDVKDGKDGGDSKDVKDGKNGGDSKDVKDGKDGGDSKDVKDGKDGGDSKDVNDGNDGGDSKDVNDGGDGKDGKDAKDTGDRKDVQGAGDSKDPKDGGGEKDGKNGMGGGTEKDVGDSKPSNDTQFPASVNAAATEPLKPQSAPSANIGGKPASATDHPCCCRDCRHTTNGGSCTKCHVSAEAIKSAHYLEARKRSSLVSSNKFICPVTDITVRADGPGNNNVSPDAYEHAIAVVDNVAEFVVGRGGLRGTENALMPTLTSSSQLVDSGKIMFRPVAKHFFADIDGRAQFAILGTPGGDLGEFFLAMHALEMVRPSGLAALTFEDILGHFQDYLAEMPNFGKQFFYFQTDSRAAKNWAADANVFSATSPGNPSEISRLLGSCENPKNVGSRFFKFMLNRPDLFGVNRALVKDVLRAFFTIYFDARHPSRPRLLWAVMEGPHEESDIIIIDRARDYPCEGLSPLILPNTGFKSSLVYHRAAAALHRADLSQWLGAKMKSSVADMGRIYMHMNHQGQKGFDVTVRKFYGNLERYTTAFASNDQPVVTK